jgi:hypothetical protein
MHAHMVAVLHVSGGTRIVGRTWHYMVFMTSLRMPVVLPALYISPCAPHFVLHDRLELPWSAYGCIWL